MRHLDRCHGVEFAVCNAVDHVGQRFRRHRLGVEFDLSGVQVTSRFEIDGRIGHSGNFQQLLFDFAAACVCAHHARDLEFRRGGFGRPGLVSFSDSIRIRLRTPSKHEASVGEQCRPDEARDFVPNHHAVNIPMNKRLAFQLMVIQS